jgi:hypothetical protein
MDEAFAGYQVINWILSLVPHIQEMEPWIHVTKEAQFNCPVYSAQDSGLNGYQLIAYSWLMTMGTFDFAASHCISTVLW